MLTRGLSRWKVLAAKAICSMSLWTICYFLCYGTTYGYNAYFWGNETVPSVFFSAFCIYLLGLWCIALMICMSTILKTGTSVLLSVGGIYMAGYVISLFPKLKKFSPVKLLSAENF